MRKAQKQKLLAAIDSLKDAHEEIRQAAQRGDAASVKRMLGECQQFAISLGESIEREEGEGHATVSRLEEYCELLFRVHEEADTGGLNVSGVQKALRKQLMKIENSARNDIHARKEVVFLPYQASMWDSMESVWREARADGDCDAYVVPIPYFERNPDGSLGEMHDERDQYPGDVPVTDWQEYHLEERDPDRIYIQNPYDSLNLVTCVHPQYFSGELKKHTEMLVYLPYFVGTGDAVGEHFCTAPGVLNADRVYVQSEEVRRTYIESIRKYEKENSCRGAFGNLEKKIQVLASPKIDRLRRVMKSGDIDIPEEWERKLRRPDGTRRKIILYNTSVGALLNNNEAYLKKLGSVLELFRRERDFLLLWRPHPLLAATIKSMRPGLYREYMELAADFKEAGFGIFDETADLDRAIVLSDAYYGDPSSVVELYRATGKPIMIQNCAVCDPPPERHPGDRGSGTITRKASGGKESG